MYKINTNHIINTTISYQKGNELIAIQELAIRHAIIPNFKWRKPKMIGLIIPFLSFFVNINRSLVTSSVIGRPLAT